MPSLNNYITATEARNNFFEFLEQVKKSPYPINITLKGIPEVVVMSKDDYDGWIATIETLSDSELMESIRQSEKDIKAGRYQSWEEVKRELGLENNYLVADRGNKKYVSSRVNKASKKRSKKTR